MWNKSLLLAMCLWCRVNYWLSASLMILSIHCCCKNFNDSAGVALRLYRRYNLHAILKISPTPAYENMECQPIDLLGCTNNCCWRRRWRTTHITGWRPHWLQYSWNEMLCVVLCDVRLKAAWSSCRIDIRDHRATTARQLTSTSLTPMRR